MNKQMCLKSKNIFESLAVLLMCMYTLMIYLVYLDKTMEPILSAILYLFMGIAIMSIIIDGKFFLNKFLMWYLGFAFLSLIALLYSPNEKASIYEFIVVLGLAFAMSVVWSDKKKFELFIKCLVIGSVVLTVYMIATGQMEVDTETGERLGDELTGNANTFASLYMVAACSSVYLIMSQCGWSLLRIIYITCFVLQEYALALSGGRKFFIVPFMVLFIMLLLKQDKNNRRHVVFCSVLIIFGVVGLCYMLMNFPILYETVGYRFESLFDYIIGESSTSDASTLEREKMRAMALELWEESPVWGHGTSAFSKLAPWGVYSHCNYTELLCNYGIIGLLYYYGLWTYSLFRLFKVKSNHIMRHFLIAIMISFILFDYGAVSFSMPVTLYFVLMASLVGEKTDRYLEEGNT